MLKETLPQNSDVVLVLSQCKAALEQFKKKHHGPDEVHRERWFNAREARPAVRHLTDDPSGCVTISTAPCRRIGQPCQRNILICREGARKWPAEDQRRRRRGRAGDRTLAGALTRP